jgi:hypothetical protein
MSYVSVEQKTYSVVTTTTYTFNAFRISKISPQPSGYINLEIILSVLIENAEAQYCDHDY